MNPQPRRNRGPRGGKKDSEEGHNWPLMDLFTGSKFSETARITASASCGSVFGTASSDTLHDRQGLNGTGAQ